MKIRFKVGDLVVKSYKGVKSKPIGIITDIDEDSAYPITVNFNVCSLEGFLKDGKAFKGSKTRLMKHRAFTPKQMLAFTNWCIANGTYKPNIDAKDLVVWINEQENQPKT
jgi:hypothetical protein